MEVRSFKGEQIDAENDEFIRFDSILGIMFLRADLHQLRNLEKLPDVLRSMGLAAANAALLYALGWTDELGDMQAGKSPKEIENIFQNLRNQPAGSDIPTEIQLNDTDRISLASSLLGAQIKVTMENTLVCEVLAESFLAALESSLATAFGQKLLPIHPLIDVQILSAPEVEFPFTFEVGEAPLKLTIQVRCSSFEPNQLTPNRHELLKNRLLDLLVTIVAHCFPGESERFRKLFETDQGLDRALAFTGSFITLGNVFGKSYPSRIETWYDDTGRTYQLKRTQRWDAQLPPPAFLRKPLTKGTSKDPDRQRGEGEIDHRDMLNISLIDPRLWDKADWKATAFLHDPQNSQPSILSLVFKNPEAADIIFSDWIKRFGKHDVNDILRVTIITGIFKSNPAAYRVVIASNLEALKKDDKQIVIQLVRSRTMEPISNDNLTLFLKKHSLFHGYFLGFSKLIESKTGEHSIEPLFVHFIAKDRLQVREAWSIGRDDPDAAGIQRDDDPIIPIDTQNAPVLKLIDWLRAF